MRLPKGKRAALAGLGAALGLSVGIGSAVAYYSDTTSAEGTLPFDASKSKTTITEEHDPEDPQNKVITVTNEKDIVCMVRVKLYFAGQDATVKATGENWAYGADGWLYHTLPLQGKGSVTSKLLADVTVTDPTFPYFDITVEQQSAPAVWDEGHGCYKGRFPVAGADGDGVVDVLMCDLTPLADGIYLSGFGASKASLAQIESKAELASVQEGIQADQDEEVR